MRFGKVEEKEELKFVDFELPPEPKESVEYIKSLPKASEMKIYIGAPAWGRKEWKGKIYPEKAKPDEFLKYYAESFNSIELNTSHYRTPEIEDIANWVSQVPNDFKFSPKFSQSISHFGGLTNPQKIHEFITRIENFGPNLGTSFIQLHENFSPKRVGDLQKFLTFIPKDFKLCIELRHPDWFKNDEIFKYLREKNIGSVITDVSARRDVLHMNVTSENVIIRFNGNERAKIDDKRMQSWVKKIKEWSNYGIKEVYFFVHEPGELVAPETADFFIKELEKAGLSTSAHIKFREKEEISLGF